MPWKETCAMNERNKLIDAWLSQEFTICELSRYFGLSRKTIYKWLERYDEEGRSGLADRSRAPHTQANRVPESLREQIINLKLRYHQWGPVTLKLFFEREQPQIQWPAASTIGRILKDAGLVKSKRKRRRVPPYTQPLEHATEPNKVWSADFKGQFELGNGKFCYPLTLSDNYSRYLLACKGLYSIEVSGVIPVYKQLFLEYGLPDAIRTDNGYPFATGGLVGLTPLSVWLIKLGITPERIQVGKPQQNGRHERMHRTLKDYSASPPAKNMCAQQRVFNRFRNEYNHIRPHRSHKGKSPAQLHCKSTRAYPKKIPEPHYCDAYLIRKIKCGGQLSLHGRKFHISKQLVGDYVGLEPIDDGVWKIYFCDMPLGIINELAGRVNRPT